ncbi:MAG: ABC transporter permease [Bernardetiaceae bacterium]
MLAFIFKRLLKGIFVVIGVIVVVFFVFQVLPGDPLNSSGIARNMDPQTLEQVRKDLGLDRSRPMQLLLYLNDIFPVSIHTFSPANEAKYDYVPFFIIDGYVLVVKKPYLRRSFNRLMPVSELLWPKLNATLWLTVSALLIATFFGILFGLISALNHNSFLDNFIAILSIIGLSIPSFVSAMIISVVFGFHLFDYTGLNMTGQLFMNTTEGKKLVLSNLILPSITLGIRPLAIITQLTRSAMIDTLSQDYIRTARAKGLPEYLVILKHALKNALNPVITSISNWLILLLTGAFFVELIFDWKGLGWITLKAVETQDLPIIMASTLIVATIFVVINVLVDIVYVLLDPAAKPGNS